MGQEGKKVLTRILTWHGTIYLFQVHLRILMRAILKCFVIVGIIYFNNQLLVMDKHKYQ